ncbi:hypothetical protein BDZ91DRAFT_546062 [Kalaharituber pfeilii]|nr:hypothetical protein BDZ91DRAFT_546062 [Kalaharituber pfeilii]
MELAASAAGLAGLAGLTLQLAQVARECADIYSGVKEVGYTHDSILHSLRTEGLRLKRWEQAWGLDTGNTSTNYSLGSVPNLQIQQTLVGLQAQALSLQGLL